MSPLYHIPEGINRRFFAIVRDVLRTLPVLCATAVALTLAWRLDGSILAPDWLPYGMLVALVAATVLFSSARRPSAPPVVCAALIAAFGFWTGISAIWSPAPALARDEFLLISLYALSLVLPALTLRTERSCELALGGVAFALGASAVGIAARARFGADPGSLYPDGRLTAPISYVNAQAAFFLVGLWPALALAARRNVNASVRALALGCASAMLAGWLSTQSKGGAVAVVVSAVVVFAAVPGRLRLLVPALAGALLVAPQYDGLTAPFRSGATDEAARDAGGIALALFVAGTAVGAVYALVDRRLTVPPRARRAAALAVAVVATLAVAIGAFQVTRHVDDPGEFVSEKWESFKQLPTTETGSSHLLSLGSNRYDFWRVSLAGFADHPVAGVGGRGFGAVYLQEARSTETPVRAHSLPLDALLETGFVGFALLAGAFLLLTIAVSRRLGSLTGAAALGTLAYFSVHASGDWIWTFPAVGIPAFLLLGIALAAGEDRPLPRRAALAGGTAAVAVALLLFAPPWLSGRVTERALAGTTAPADLVWARRLDPLAIEPLLAEARLAGAPAQAVAPLEHAAAKEPRNVAVRYLLGLAYLDAGRPGEARAELQAARRLYPGSEEIARALARIP